MDPNPTPTTTTLDEDQTSKTTTDEPDQANEMGSGRSYECVFCKRGFTTAQALGGHMNIHRKDRVKTKPSTTTNNPSKPQSFSHTHSSFSPSTTTSTLISTSHHQSFQTYFPTSSSWCLGSTTTSTTPSQDHQLSYVHNTLNIAQYPNTSFKENWTNISLASHSPAPDSTNRRDKSTYDNENDDDGGDDDDDGLDLELRLGNDR